MATHDEDKIQRALKALAIIYGRDVPWLLVVGTAAGDHGTLTVGNTPEADQVERLRVLVKSFDEKRARSLPTRILTVRVDDSE